MLDKEYIINGKIYTTQQSPRGISILNPDGDTWMEATGPEEMETKLREAGVLSREDRRKIDVYSRGVLRELLGEWMTDEERYTKFRRRVLSWTTTKYNYTIPPSYEEYKILHHPK